MNALKGTAYSVANSFQDETGGIISYETVPLIREKRQTKISLPPVVQQNSSSQISVQKFGAFWGNKTRMVDPAAPEKTLLRSSTNVFTTPTNLTEQGIEPLYSNGTSEEVLDFPEDVDDFAKSHNVTAKVL